MRTALTVACVLTIAACAFLAASYLILKGPEDLRPVLTLAVFVAPAAITLAVLGLRASSVGVQTAMFAGGAVLVWIGWRRIDATLAASQFEGYNLVLGAMIIGQGILTILTFATRSIGPGRSVLRG